jgi:hypothetical protein
MVDAEGLEFGRELALGESGSETHSLTCLSVSEGFDRPETERRFF